MKMSGMFVILFRGINQGFWNHLGVNDKMPLFVAVKGLFMVSLEEIIVKEMLLFRFFG